MCMHQRYFCAPACLLMVAVQFAHCAGSRSVATSFSGAPDYWSTAMSSPILGHTGGAWRSFAAQNIHRRHMLKELFTDELI